MRVNGALVRGLIVLGCAATSLILGYIGLRTFVLHQAGLGRSWVDILFADVQLFVLQAPLNGPGPYSLPLQIARFLAPGTTIVPNPPDDLRAGQRVRPSRADSAAAPGS